MKYSFEGRPQPGAGAAREATPVADAETPAVNGVPTPAGATPTPSPAVVGEASRRIDTPLIDGEASPRIDPPVDAAPTPSLAAWSALLPALEAELAAEIKIFRKSMKGARILPDFTNRDIFPPSRSGAWEIYHDERTLPDGTERRFTIYVRRTSDQLAVNEDGGHPYVISANFTTAFPWALPSADDVRRNMAARMRSLGVRPQ